MKDGRRKGRWGGGGILRLPPSASKTASRSCSARCFPSAALYWASTSCVVGSSEERKQGHLSVTHRTGPKGNAPTPPPRTIDDASSPSSSSGSSLLPRVAKAAAAGRRRGSMAVDLILVVG